MTTSHPDHHQDHNPTGNLPDDLDWECNFDVRIERNNQVSTTKDTDWTWALEYAGENITEMLTSPGTLFHDSLNGFHVAYGFKFRIDDDCNIVADGACYAAHITERDFITYFDQILAEATITITPTSDRTRQALETYIRTHSNP